MSERKQHSERSNDYLHDFHGGENFLPTMSISCTGHSWRYYQM